MNALSPETSEFFHFMMENELLDVDARKNKQVGGYMEYLPEFRAPFIFANFNGTSGDVDVITHECGHAFQGYLIGKEDPVREHWDITMETAEIHSMSMEFFTNPWMDWFFEREGRTFSWHSLRMPRYLFPMDVWWTNFSILCTITRSLPRGEKGSLEEAGA